MALSKKQRAFINEYLTCWNATEAARRAGYAEASARISGSKNMSNANISAEIQRRIDEMAMSADEVLMHLADIARPPVTPADFLNDETRNVVDRHGNAVDVVEVVVDWDKVKEYGHLIKSISFTAAGPKIEFYSRMDALQLLGKHHRLFVDRQEVDHTSGGEPLGSVVDTALKKVYADADNSAD